MNEIHIKTCFEKYSAYEKRRLEEQGKIDQLDARLCHLPGSVIKMPDNPKDFQSKQIDLITKKIELEKGMKDYADALNLVRDVLCKCPKYAKLITEKYIERKTAFYLQNKYGYSERQLRRLVDRCIEEYLEIVRDS